MGGWWVIGAYADPTGYYSSIQTEKSSTYGEK